MIAFRVILAAALALSLTKSAAGAATFPVNKCVSSKQLEAGKYCKKALDTWAKWLKKQDDGKRNSQLQKFAGKLSDKWAKAEEKSLSKGSDCADTTASAAEVIALIDMAIGTAAGTTSGIVGAISDGLALGNTPDGKCGGKLLKAVGKKCLAVLKAESKHVKKPDKDPAGSKLAESLDKASTQFSQAWAKGFAAGCPTTATETQIEDLVDALKDDVVLTTTVSPNVDDTQFTTYSPVGTIKYEGRNFAPKCVFDTPYHYFAKRGSVNKLLMYYQGGGACWEQLTCTVPVCDDSVNPGGNDNPNNATSGFFDLANPSNPFKDWNIVVVPYCSCDIHFGDAAQDYDNFDPDNPLHVEHRGFHNAKVVEKFAREHFVKPETVFVTGSSAGAYGALFHGGLLHDVWPASQIHVLADAGNGVITADFLQNEFSNWNFVANLPPDIPGVVESITDGTGMVGYIDAVASFYPNTTWAHYTSAFDGGSGGQTGFYNVMLNDNDPLAGLTWWEGSCAFNQVMKQQVVDTFALVPDNYRYYIGTGSAHTMWFRSKVYNDTTGGVPLLVDWVSAMLNSTVPGAPDAGWVNVEASPFNVLLPGDVQPSPLAPPFEMSGSDIVVNCP